MPRFIKLSRFNFALEHFVINNVIIFSASYEIALKHGTKQAVFVENVYVDFFFTLTNISIVLNEK